MQKILVSACLLGMKVRYDNTGKACMDARFMRWHDEGRLVSICPEVTGGLPTPRESAERNEGRVLTRKGVDVTSAFASGAQAALALAREHGIRIAIMKQRSPSCGSREIYDGTFSGHTVEGEGMTVALLRQHGIRVFGEDQLEEAEQALVLCE